MHTAHLYEPNLEHTCFGPHAALHAQTHSTVVAFLRFSSLIEGLQALAPISDGPDHAAQAVMDLFQNPGSVVPTAYGSRTRTQVIEDLCHPVRANSWIQVSGMESGS